MLFFAGILYNSAHAQLVITEKDDEEKIVISDNNTTSINKNFKISKNNLKVDVLGAIFGKYGVSYERELFDFLSVESTIGLTYINFADYYLSLFMGDRSAPLGSSNNLQLRNYTSENILNAKPGYFIDITPKVFFRADGFEGVYLGLSFNYNHFNYKESNKIETYNAIDKKQIGGKVQIGGQVINGKMVLDLSTSFGIYNNHTNLFDKLDQNKYNTQFLSFYYGIGLKLGRNI